MVREIETVNIGIRPVRCVPEKRNVREEASRTRGDSRQMSPKARMGLAEETRNNEEVDRDTDRHPILLRGLGNGGHVRIKVVIQYSNMKEI